MGHSPTPYITRPFTDVRFAVDSVSYHGSYIEAHPDFNDGHAVATLHGPQHEANATFIVRACNSHQALVNALNQAQAALRTIACRIDYRDDELIAYAHAEANKAYEPLRSATP